MEPGIPVRNQVWEEAVLCQLEKGSSVSERKERSNLSGTEKQQGMETPLPGFIQSQVFARDGST